MEMFVDLLCKKMINTLYILIFSNYNDQEITIKTKIKRRRYRISKRCKKGDLNNLNKKFFKLSIRTIRSRQKSNTTNHFK